MPTITIPDFTLDSKPTLATVRSAEQAIFAAVGGVLAGTKYPGDLDALNISPDTRFQLSQVQEGRHRICLAPGRFNAIGALPGAAVTSAYLVALEDVDCDALTLWHNVAAGTAGAEGAKGKISAWINGVLYAELAMPAQGAAAGESVEWPFRAQLKAGAELELRLVDGTSLITDTAGAAVPTYARFYPQVWGVTNHRSS